MIWETQHLIEDAKRGGVLIHDFMEKQSSFSSGKDRFRVGIVGGGPKGMYAIDQFFEEIKKKAIDVPVEVLWVNRANNFGCGPNYDTDQPDYLLINYCIAHIDAWLRTESTMPDERLNLMDWIRQYGQDGANVQPTDFASRALVGHYLQYCAMEVIRAAPSNVRLLLMAETVKDIVRQPGNRYTIQTDNHNVSVDNILLATGHCYENTALIGGQDSVPSNYISRAYPIRNLDHIPAKSRVGIVGLGLTFIDVALHLTEGRGGIFDCKGNYIPSGQEPTLFPFSRNHLPILPRGPIYGENVYQLHYLNTDWVEQMSTTYPERDIDFFAEIYPMLEKEIRFAYYSTLLRTRDETTIEQYIDALEENQRFGIDDLLFPKIEKKESIQKSYIDYIEQLICEATKGENQSPLMAAAAVWREATPIIGKWYKNGGFTGDAQCKLDKELFGAFCRVSFGPPISNMKKILALLKAGIIQMAFENPVEVSVDEQYTCLTLHAENTVQSVDFIIDARIARPNLAKNNSGLYSQLLQNGLLAPLENGTYQPGCPRMNEDGRSLVNGQEPQLYFYGSNTEGFLLDNDSLSRTKNNLASRWAASTIQQITKETTHDNTR